MIAERLGRSAKTVANNVSGIVAKVGAEDRADAIRVIRGAAGGFPGGRTG